MNKTICNSCANHLHKKECELCIDNSKYEELYNAGTNCKHKIICANGGGIKCIKCGGWFCY